MLPGWFLKGARVTTGILGSDVDKWVVSAHVAIRASALSPLAHVGLPHGSGDDSTALGNLLACAVPSFNAAVSAPFIDYVGPDMEPRYLVKVGSLDVAVPHVALVQTVSPGAHWTAPDYTNGCLAPVYAWTRDGGRLVAVVAATLNASPE
jgi:hypothetical protein